MSDIQSIHEFDVNMICEYFSALHRQGPGSPEVTKKALGFIEGLSPDSHIADIGCGTGGQTMTLAKSTSARISGIDLFPGFIEQFNAAALGAGVAQRVKGRVASMEELPFAPEELDLIWSEGAIYNIGFQRGLGEWKPFIKTGGYIAVSEISWFTDRRPAEIEDFWMDAYPEINTIPAKLGQMQAEGYRPTASFILPESCWIDHFYAPQPRAQETFLANHPENALAREFIKNQRHEQALYMKYKDFYGYVFYIGKKVSV